MSGKGERGTKHRLAQLPASVKHFPAPSTVFTGCDRQVSQVKTCLLGGTNERRICVVHGLGGAGKTQIALQAIEMTKGSWSDIIYVDATSRDSTISCLKEFAVAKQIGETHMDAIRWLESSRQPWLLVFDNADDPDLGLSSLFPKGSHGSILITTRLRDLALLGKGPDSACKVGGMNPEDAVKLLLKKARLQDRPLLDGDREAAAELVKDFGYLALAIVHAGAYVYQSNSSVADYRKHFLEQPHIFLGKHNQVPAKIEEHQATVYTTWSTIYERLKPHTQKMLWFLAFLHHDGITENIFRRGAMNAQHYDPKISPDNDETNALAEVKTYLGTFLDGQKDWRSNVFIGVMGELQSYSLLGYDRVNKAYTLHVLVQEWARTLIPYSKKAALEHTSLLLALSIDESAAATDYAFRRTLGPHINKTLDQQVQTNSNNAAGFAQVFGELGQWGSAETLWLQVLDSRKRVLGEEHPDTLTSMRNLASIYQSQTRMGEAEALQVQVVDAMKRVLGEEHPETLISTAKLVSNYSDQGRSEKAEALGVKLVATMHRVLGVEHPQTLASVGILASNYQQQGQWEQAEMLQTQLVVAMKRTLGEEHPDTLAGIGNLALTYSKQGRSEKAEALQMQVSGAKRRVLGEEHPETLLEMAKLASNYWSQGRWKDAEVLGLKVVDSMVRVLGKEHPDTLTSMHNLALTYESQDRLEEAEALSVKVVNIAKRVFGERHPQTLSNMVNLATIYARQGQWDRGEALQEQVVDGWKRGFGEHHPETLSAQRILSAFKTRANQERRRRR